MLAYLEGFGAGIVVGIGYALIRVKSPAPPTIGLVGLAGMLIGFSLLKAVA